MAVVKGNVMVAQSGGPTAVINASVCGAIQEAMMHNHIFDEIYGAEGGIWGLMNDKLFDIRKEDPAVIDNLKHTPGAALGSIRYKLKTKADYEAVIHALKKYNIRYFFYAGGNDSMDTADKVNKLAIEMGYDLVCIGIPKTVDNDLPFTDHCPGYPSAAKYLATMVAETDIDQRDLPTTPIVIVEAMGRNAGWLAGAGALANRNDYPGQGPHLVYLPEVDFHIADFVADVAAVYKEHGRAMIVVSEGIHTAAGKLIGESGKLDAFGHAQLGGCANTLKEILDREIGVKSRVVLPASAQRAGAHCASLTDVNEAWGCGKRAVELAVAGVSGVMVQMVRQPGPEYKIAFESIELSRVANVENKVPRSMINEKGNNVTEEFIQYARPLIEGQPNLTFKDGLPWYSTLAKHFIK
ncbi:MAG: 6-phosphofructokinase [Bacillota bacterium]